MSKKGHKGKAAKVEEPKGLDPLEYARKTVEVAELEKVPPLSAQMSAKIVNIESLFPEFENIHAEDWVTPVEGENIVYPEHITVASSKAIRQLLNLDYEPPEEDGKKGKKDKKDKKPAKGTVVAMEFIELEEDENGVKQPKMYWGTNPLSETEFSGFPIPYPFVRHWSTEQEERRAEQHRLKQLADDEVERNENADPTEHVEEEEFLDKNHHQDAYAAALQERDVETETSMGVEADPVMCSIFRYIERYAPNVTPDARPAADVGGSRHEGLEYLWRAIYPQLPNGRPMYNPNGKYVVRLYLGGKWRKVTVNDVIPLDANGLPVVCCSATSLELWPMILAKAVYAAYAACQYNGLTGALGLFPTGIACDTSEMSISAATFASFAVHVLTGWLPSNPFPLVDNISNNEGMDQLLTSIVAGGAADIARSNIPGENPAENIDDDPDRPRNIPKTLKTLRSEFERRINVRNTLIANIQDRESKINTLEEATKASYNESYCVCFQDEDSSKGMRVLPILAVSAPEDASLSAEDRITNTLFLTGWHRGDMIFAEPKGDEICKGIGGAMEEALTRPIPGSCTISQDWVDVKTLLERGATFFCLDTLVTTPNRALLGWHWMPPPEEVVAVDPKAKGKKPPKDAKVEPINPSIVINPGELPTMFLKMDTSGLTADSSDTTLTVFVHNDVLQQIPEEPESEFPRGNTLLLEEILQNGEDNSTPLRVSVELTQTERLPFTKISVQLPSAQLSKCPSTIFWIRIIGDGSSLIQFGVGVPVEVGEAHQIWEGVAGKHILVRDGEVTKPMRCEEERLVFRQLLQLASGTTECKSVVAFLHVSNKEIFKCINQVITTDDSADNSYSRLPRPDGNYVQVTPDSAVLLVGRIYHYAAHLPGFSWKLTVISDLPLQPHEVLTETTGDKYIGGYRPNNKVMLFRDVISAEKDSFPLSIRFALKPVDYLQTVLANSGAAPDGVSSRPASAAAVAVDAPSTLLGPRPGSPNFFGDVPTTEAESILEPHFTYLPSEGESKDIDNYDNRNGLLSNVSFILKTYRKYDRKLVGEYKSANGFLSLYNIAADGYVDKNAPPPAAAVPGTVSPNVVEIIVECILDPSIKIPLKWQHKWPYQFMAKENTSSENHAGGGGEGSPGSAVSGRPVSGHPTSGRPVSGHSLSSVTVSKHFNASSPPTHPLFLWQVDVLGGKVTNTMHDLHDLEAALAIKTKWEEEKAGRAARALAAMEAYGEKKEIHLQTELSQLDEELDIEVEKSPSKSNAVSPRSAVGGNGPAVTMDKVIENLATALEKPVDVIAEREKLIAQCSTYREFIEEELLDNEEYAPAQLITPESILKSRTFQEGKAKAHEDESERLNAVIANYSEAVRLNTKERIGILVSTGNINLETAKEMWAKREQYKVEISNRNAALRYLLSRGSDAIAATSEDANDKKKKGGKKK